MIDRVELILELKWNLIVLRRLFTLPLICTFIAEHIAGWVPGTALIFGIVFLIQSQSFWFVFFFLFVIFLLWYLFTSCKIIWFPNNGSIKDTPFLKISNRLQLNLINRQSLSPISLKKLLFIFFNSIQINYINNVIRYQFISNLFF